MSGILKKYKFERKRNVILFFNELKKFRGKRLEVGIYVSSAKQLLNFPTSNIQDQKI